MEPPFSLICKGNLRKDYPCPPKHGEISHDAHHDAIRVSCHILHISIFLRLMCTRFAGTQDTIFSPHKVLLLFQS